jgi:hypothetical protein
MEGKDEAKGSEGTGCRILDDCLDFGSLFFFSLPFFSLPVFAMTTTTTTMMIYPPPPTRQQFLFQPFSFLLSFLFLLSFPTLLSAFDPFPRLEAKRSETKRDPKKRP